MEKTTSKGTQVYFERTQEYFDKLAAQKAARIADIEKSKAERNEYLNGKIDELKSKIDAAKKNGSSRLSGEGRLDFQKKVF